MVGALFVGCFAVLFVFALVIGMCVVSARADRAANEAQEREDE